MKTKKKPKCFGHMDWFKTGKCHLCQFINECYKLSFEEYQNIEETKNV